MQKRGVNFILIVLGLALLAGVAYKITNYKLGLDVQGGVRFTYAVDLQAQPSGQGSKSMETILDDTRTILERRIQSVTGVAEGQVFIKGGNQVVVEIPGYADIQKASQEIGTSASLKVYWANNVQTDSDSYRKYKDLNGDENSDNPSVDFMDTLKQKTLKPGDPDYVKMITGGPGQDGWQLLASGADLVSAQPEAVGNGTYRPTMNFTSDAGDRIQKWSQKYLNRGEKVAMVLDNRVLQIAPVEKGATLGSSIVVNGAFTPKYVNGLCNLLNAGALPVDLKLLSAEKVDPTIGKAALGKMMFAGAIAFGVISTFLIVYYAFPGIVAFIALLLYVLFTLTVLKLLGATFSLAAIAGFVLSVGMAVDANILVFERFKEEIKRGRDLHKALDLGFKRAFPAILDSNMCSILTSLILAYYGSGPVKGFATTLIIGVTISLFTAVTVTRSLLFFLIDSGIGHDVKMYALGRSWFGERLEETAQAEPLQIVNNAKKWFTITAVVLAVGIAFMAVGGLKFNVEFTGGVEATFPRGGNFPSLATINSNLKASGVDGASVQYSQSDNGQKLAIITVPGVAAMGSTPADQTAYVVKTAGLPADSVASSLSSVGGVIQKETWQNAIYGVVGAFLAIIIYLAFRFGLMLGSWKNGFRFGVSAIAAGAKDIVVIFGVAALLGKVEGWKLSSLFITAMLTVIGFSVHDKIVIFDRIRENLRRPLTGETFEHLVNRSITQSFARSINTAAAVVATLGILAVFGTTTEELRFFLVITLAGIAWGTYSSIYTAAPLLNLWENWIAKNKGQEHTLLAAAIAENSKSRIIGRVQVATPAAPTAAPTTAPDAAKPTAGERSYGQVRRRASQVDKSKIELDD